MSKTIFGTKWSDIQMNEFKRNYNKAIKAGDEQFVSNGHEWLVSLAKYMVQYMDMK